MMGALQAAWRLPASERPIVLRAAALLILCQLSLKLFGLAHTRRWMEHGVPPALSEVEALSKCQRISQLMHSVSRRLPMANTCLARALTLRRLLAGFRLDAQLQIGVRLEQGTLEAHAWVNHHGLPVNEPEELKQRFAPLQPPPSPHERDRRHSQI